MRYWIGLAITILLGSIAGGLSSYFVETPVLRELTSFISGAMIGLIGYELTSAWADNDPYR